MPFSNPIVAGTSLVRSAIKSPNYVVGVAGWTINADGFAEFANLSIVNGTVVVKFTDGSYQKIYGGNYTYHNASTATVPGTWLALQPPNQVGSTYQPGVIGATEFGPQPAIVIASPWDSSLPSDWTSEINLGSRGIAGGSAEIDMSAERITMNVTQSGLGFKTIELHGSLSVDTGNTTITGDLTVTPTNAVTITPGGAAVTGTHQFNGTPLWNGYAVTGGGIAPGNWFVMPVAFQNGFKDRILGGTFPAPAYWIDAFGRVYLRGTLTGGAASAIGASIMTLPAGMRPSSTVMCPVCANGGTETFGRIDVNPNGTLTWRGPVVVTAGVNWFSIDIDWLAEA